MAGFQVYSFASGMINTIIGAASGDWTGVGAGIGGMVGGAFGWQAAVAGASLFTQQALGTFGAGFITGAIEFGAAGFGAGFGGALVGGASFGDAITAGLIAGGVGAVAGGIIQGSYHAGWQNSWHGASYGEILSEKGVEREVALYRGYSDILADNDLHEGVEIMDNYREISGRWEFDVYPRTPWTKGEAARGIPVLGTWQVRREPFAKLKFVSDEPYAAQVAYNAVKSQLGKLKIYHISGIPSNCRTETNSIIRRALQVIKK